MNTSPVLNPAGVSANSGAKPRQASDAAVDMPFNQMLSREVAGRRSASDAGRPSPKEAAEANASAQPPAASQQAAPAEEGRRKEAEPAEPALAGEDAATMQMLALAAQFGLANALPADAPGDSAEAPLTDAADRAAGMGKAGSTDRLLIAALPDQKQGSERISKEALSASSNFDALMEQAHDQNALLASASDKSRAGLTAGLQPAVDLHAGQPQEAQPGLSAATLAPLQQAAFGKAQSIPGLPADKLALPVGTTGWDQSLGQKMVWMVAGAQQSASLTLNPPDLGPLQVVLNVSSGQATANFIAAQPEVRQALEAALPKLREMLEGAGIQLGQANVSAGTPNQHGSFGDQQQASRHADTSGADTPLHAIRSTPATVRQGMVDTFA